MIPRGNSHLWFILKRFKSFIIIYLINQNILSRPRQSQGLLYKHRDSVLLFLTGVYGAAKHKQIKIAQPVMK